jgi:hypothetical protein
MLFITLICFPLICRTYLHKSGFMSMLLFMYRRPILCTLYGAVDFLKCPEEKLLVGGGDVCITGT